MLAARRDLVTAARGSCVDRTATTGVRLRTRLGVVTRAHMPPSQSRTRAEVRPAAREPLFVADWPPTRSTLVHHEDNFMVQARWNGAIIADSDATIVIEGNHYFPPEAVNRNFLEAT